MRASCIRLNTRGSVAVEFALLLPVLLIFLFGIIDVGLWMWAQNRAEKATQAGVRHAAVTGYVAQGLESIDFAARYYGGYRMPAGLLPDIDCYGASSTCQLTCNSPDCDPDSVTSDDINFSTEAFTAILNAVRGQFPEAQAENLVIRYRHVGLGYAGDPNGSDVSPLVTVEIRDNLNTGDRLFRPLFLGLYLPNGFDLTGVRSTMTMEDGSGTASFSA